MIISFHLMQFVFLEHADLVLHKLFVSFFDDLD